MFTTNFKTHNYRNKKIRQLANGQACQHCGKNDGTTVAAHEDGIASGKGTGLKSGDHRVAYLCYNCHSDYDGRRGDFSKNPERELNFYRAILKTQDLWIGEICN
jgi:predicted RNA-binding Zn-ribbon protein involved in translation (DUF1610 family)